MSRTVLITGATGNQGGAPIKTLSALPNAKEFQMYAVTRNPSSETAQKLSKKYPNVKLVQGDLENPNAIFKSISVGIWGVFSVQTPFGGKASVESEEKQGKALIDAALANNVSHFVYSSVDRGGARSDTDETNVPHFASKARIEKYLKEKTANSSMTWSILRPVFFMENITEDMQDKLMMAAWRDNVTKRPLQLVATTDIGFFAARALNLDRELAGQAISIAGDEVTFKEAQQVYKRSSGHDMKVGAGVFAWLLLKAIKDLGLMFYWFNDIGYGADAKSLRQINPNMLDFSSWVA